MGCKTQKLELNTVKEVNLERYMGTWYEIARLPNSFEEGLNCVTANYSLNSNGSVKVVNRGVDEDKPEKLSEASGKAKVPNTNEPGKLKVTFFWPFYGKYWILKLDEQYHYAIVGEPSGKYLWILSRSPQIDDELLNDLVQFCSKQGFDTRSLIFTEQDCN